MKLVMRAAERRRAIEALTQLNVAMAAMGVCMSEKNRGLLQDLRNQFLKQLE